MPDLTEWHDDKIAHQFPTKSIYVDFDWGGSFFKNVQKNIMTLMCWIRTNFYNIAVCSFVFNIYNG